MTRQEMTELFSVMMLAWPNAEMFKGGIQKLGPTINLWALCLEDVDFWLGQQAVVKLCKECKFPPSIAEFKEKASDISRDMKYRIEQEWSYVRYRLDHGTPQEVFEQMRDGIAKQSIASIGGPDNLIVKDEHIYGDGRRVPYEHYNFDGFYQAYETILRQSSALMLGSSKAASATTKQITGGK